MNRTAKITITLIVLLLVVIGGLWYFQKRKTSCPQDTQTCTDGTVVRRVEPSCNFADCPQGATTTATSTATTTATTTPGTGTSTATSTPTGTSTNVFPPGSLKTRKEQGVEYQYYKKLTATYIFTQTWPPTVRVSSGTLPCSTSSQGETVQKIIEGQTYCVKKTVGAAAGSTYATYQYATRKSDRLVTISFALRTPQCANYDEPGKTACTNEQKSFNPDDLVKPIISTIKFTSTTSADKSDLIRVDSPKPDTTVFSPLTIKGQARGNWYFEATFPVALYDSAGKQIVRSFATAQGNWMTTDFVPFEAKLNFSAPVTSTGTLVLEKDNPSGLPENDDKIELPVKFR